MDYGILSLAPVLIALVLSFVTKWAHRILYGYYALKSLLVLW